MTTTTTMNALATIPACADRFANLAGFCHDRQTPVFDDLRCSERRSTATRSPVATDARCAPPTPARRRWTIGTVRSHVESAISVGGKGARLDAWLRFMSTIERAYGVRWPGLLTAAEKATLRALEVGQWTRVTVGAVTVTARAVVVTTARGATYVSTEIRQDHSFRTEAQWHAIAWAANGN
jgi:hypothetical protein